MDVRLLTVEGCARYLGTSPGAIRMRIFRGIYPPRILIKQGRRLYIDLRSMNSLRSPAANESRGGPKK